MMVVKGKDKLYLYKLTNDSLLINMASTCCHSFLMCHHPVYHGKGRDFCAVANLQAVDDSKPLARWFTNLWKEQELKQCDCTVPHLWVTSDGQVTGNVENWADVFQAQCAAIQTPIPDDDIPGETFEDIMNHVGKDKIVIVQ